MMTIFSLVIFKKRNAWGKKSKLYVWCCSSLHVLLKCMSETQVAVALGQCSMMYIHYTPPPKKKKILGGGAYWNHFVHLSSCLVYVADFVRMISPESFYCF